MFRFNKITKIFVKMGRVGIEATHLAHFSRRAIRIRIIQVVPGRERTQTIRVREK